MARKIFCFIIAFFYFFSLMATLWLFGLKQTLLNVDYYKTILKKSDFYSHFIDDATPYIFEKIAKEKNIPPEVLSAKEVSAILKKTFPESWIQNQTELALDGFSDYITGKREKVVVTLDLAGIKKPLSDQITRSFNEVWAKLPSCSIIQLSQIETTDNPSLAILCRPPGVKVNQIISAIISGQNGLVSHIPDKYEIGNNLPKDSWQGLSDARNVYRTYFQILIISLVVTLVLLIILILLNLKWPKGAIKWVAIPSICASAIVLIVSFATPFIGSNLILKNIDLGLSPDLNNLIISVLKTSLNEAAGKLMIISSSVLGVSAALLIASHFLFKNKEIVQKEEKPVEPKSS